MTEYAADGQQAEILARMPSGREFRYRKRVRWMQYAVPPVCAALGSYLFVFVSFAVKPGPVVILGLGLAILLYTFLLWLPLYRKAGARVTLRDDGIVYSHRRGETCIPFSEITQLKFTRLPAAGWMKILSRNRAVRLTVDLEDIDELLVELVRGLDRMGLQDRYDKRKAFRFLKTAVYCNQGSVRLYETFWALCAFIVFSSFTGLTLAWWSGQTPVTMILWMLISLEWPLLGYLLAEIFLSTRLAQEFTEGEFACPPRDVALEKRVYRIAIALGTVLYAGAVFFALFA